jgi:hypothetical protein
MDFFSCLSSILSESRFTLMKITKLSHRDEQANELTRNVTREVQPATRTNNRTASITSTANRYDRQFNTDQLLLTAFSFAVPYSRMPGQLCLPAKAPDACWKICMHVNNVHKDEKQLTLYVKSTVYHTILICVR